ncbi:glyoxalase/bleomycin resistance/dioxygenase family protein [Halobacillus litoralis]|uniref:Glyoxalase/bleomycin resistance/dioxygenase family protein n=1 Tax=Halobacillus litoralis TaxID=45668 RepID=A0A845EE03_9BACI|nr:VOC family protein [Halobacillus litoralis]MYL49941.1 glyoxalase/bleomycin resistance/dioxygenase family protein [Halobacillus litoralis]
MNVDEFGLILFVERFEQCVSFYQNRLQLPVRRRQEMLVCFDLPIGYLMVEKGGVAQLGEKTRIHNPTVLRFDVKGLSKEVHHLKERGIHFLEEQRVFDWGTIAVLLDPDGNRIELGEVNAKSASYRT